MASKLTLNSTVKLNTGYEQPILGLGVYKLPPVETAQICTEALRVGYRHIDTAEMYKNQGQCAAGLAASGVPRDQVFFTSKVVGEDGWPLNYDTAMHQVNLALTQTGYDFLDLVLIHAPYGGSEGRKGAWKALVECVEAGKIRSIGVSNYGMHHLAELETHIKELEEERGGKGKGGVVSVGQWEIHPWINRDEIVQWCRERDVVVQAYCAIVRGQRFGEPKLVGLADKYGKSEAQILLRWSLQAGYVALVRTSNLSRVAENADLYDFELTEEEVAGLKTGEYSPCAWDPTTEPLEA